MKYDTLKQLADAYLAGDVKALLMLDNDATAVYDEEERVFEMHPADVLDQALSLLGIPHESV